MSRQRAPALLAVCVSISLLAALAVAGSSGATTPPSSPATTATSGQRDRVRHVSSPPAEGPWASARGGIVDDAGRTSVASVLVSTVVIIPGGGDPGETWRVPAGLLSADARVCYYSHLGTGRALLRPRSRRSPVGPTDFTPCSKRWARRGRTWSSRIHSVAAKPSPSPRCLPMTLSVWCWSTPPHPACPRPFALPSLTPLRAWTRTTIRNESTFPGRTPSSPRSARSVRCRSWSHRSDPCGPQYGGLGVDAASAAHLEDVWQQGQRAWAELSTRGQLVVVADSGHFIHVDQPAIGSTTSGPCPMPRQHHRPRRH